MTDDFAPDWKCDLCGEPWTPEAARYTIRDDEEKRTFRHYRCHEARNAKLTTDLELGLARVRSALGRVRSVLREADRRQPPDRRTDIVEKE